MEYAKDIILEMKKGQAVERKNAKVFLTKIYKIAKKHKMILTVLTATISFIIIDLLLISSFINLLTKI